MSDKKALRGLVNVTEAAAFLSVSRSKLYQLMASGELPYVKLGRSRRVPKLELSKLIERNLHSGHSGRNSK